MRARSGHRPSFFFVLFSLLFYCLCSGIAYFPLAFRGKQTFFFSMRPNRVDIAGSPGLGDSGSFPHAPLAVNMEMTTLLERKSFLRWRCACQSDYPVTYTLTAFSHQPPPSSICGSDHATTHFGSPVACPTRSRGLPRVLRSDIIHSDLGRSPTEFLGFYLPSETICPVLRSPPLLRSLGVRRARSIWQGPVAGTVNVKQHNRPRCVALAPLSSSAIQCEIEVSM